MITSVELIHSDGELAIKLLKEMLGNNHDGHLSVGECIALKRAIDALEIYRPLYSNSVNLALRARADAEYNAGLVDDTRT